MRLTPDHLARIALDAGAIIMRIYESDFSVRHKADTSPVTQADAEAEAYILAALLNIEPDLHIIAEEACDAGFTPDPKGRFALVDPLDGTKAFIAKRDAFTVNIALIEAGRPIMGVVYAPALQRLFVASSPLAAWQARIAPGASHLPDEDAREPLHIRRAPPEGLTALTSLAHADRVTQDFLARFAIAETLASDSSLKFCLIAAGEADLYPRFAPTMAWDTAAGHVVAEAAGARITRADSSALTYGPSNPSGLQNPAFIVWGDVSAV